MPPSVTRGELTVGVPAWRSRAGVFDDLVLDTVARLAGRRDDLGDLELIVQDVPPPGLEAREGLVADGTAGGEVPLAQALPGGSGANPRIVVYRRPLELRAADPEDLRDLLHEVVVDALAELLGIDPDEVDPG